MREIVSLDQEMLGTMGHPGFCESAFNAAQAARWQRVAAFRMVFPYHYRDEHSRDLFPQACCVILMECGTHVIFDAEITLVQQGEHCSVRMLISRSVSSRILLLCDTRIVSREVLQTARQKGTYVLARHDKVTWKKTWVRLHDGTYLAEIYYAKHQRDPALTVQIIEYLLKEPTAGQLGEPIRWVTLNPAQYPIDALIQAHHEHGGIEGSINKVKTHRSLARRTLRS